MLGALRPRSSLCAVALPCSPAARSGAGAACNERRHRRAPAQAGLHADPGLWVACPPPDPSTLCSVSSLLSAPLQKQYVLDRLRPMARCLVALHKYLRVREMRDAEQRREREAAAAMAGEGLLSTKPGVPCVTMLCGQVSGACAGACVCSGSTCMLHCSPCCCALFATSCPAILLLCSGCKRCGRQRQEARGICRGGRP